MIEQSTLDLLRLVFGISASLVVAVSAIVPLFSTVIPYRRMRTQAWYFLWRIIGRVAIALLILYDVSFSYFRLFAPDFNRDNLLLISILIMNLIIIGQVLSWVTHPEGVKGL